MRLQTYLDRIGYEQSVTTNLATLTALARRHVCSVPFENLDVQLGRTLTTRTEDAYDKIVEGERGGWCYEQNAVFGWALSEIGFDVTRVSAAVLREQRGEAATASHLCLLVSWPGSGVRYLADVGFGGSLFGPIPLEDSRHNHPPFELGLTRLGDSYWRFWEDLGDGPFTFDFADEAANEEALARKCAFLQSDPSSSFVQNLVAQLRTIDRHLTLRGRVFTVAGSGSKESRLLDTPEALLAVLETEFGLDVPEVAGLWPRITARHDALFGDRADVQASAQPPD